MSDSKIKDNKLSVSGPTFWNSFRWLLWKNFKTSVIRRPCAFATRIFLPAFFLLILYFLRETYDVDVYPTAMFDLTQATSENADGNLCSPFDSFSGYLGCIYATNTQYGEWLGTPPSLDHREFIDNLLCFETTEDDNDKEYDLPAFSIAFVPNPFDNTSTNINFNSNFSFHYANLFSILNQTYQSNFNATREDELLDITLAEYNAPLKESGVARCKDYASYLPFEEGWLLRFFDNEKDLKKFVKDDDYGTDYYVSNELHAHRPIGISIVFDDISDDGLEWKYTLRFNGSRCGDTNVDIDEFTRNYQDLYDESIDDYLEGSFVNIQFWIDEAITYYISQIDGLKNNNNSNNNMDDSIFIPFINQTLSNKFEAWSFPMPVERYETDDFWSDFETLYVFFLLIQFIYPINNTISVLVEEKSQRIKEGLRMMGGTYWSYWLSWIVWYIFEWTLITIFMTIIASGLDVFEYSEWSVIFVWYYTFGLSLLGLSILIASLFDNPKMASLFGCVVWIALLFAGGFAQLLGPGGKIAICLLSPTGGGVAWLNMQTYETALIGINWDNINDKYDDFRFSVGLIMFAFDFVWYTLLGLYLDTVWPSRYGSKRPFYFICQKSTYQDACGKKYQGSKNEQGYDLPPNTNRVLSRKFSLMDTDVYEDVTEQYDQMEPAIQIRHLRKYFSGGTLGNSDSVVKAVNGVSLDMYIGECFCLLGHNGAGKTTLISMLSGLIDITSGDALILNNNVKTEPNKARQCMGVCPQKDVLFPLLTVEEHLRMFAKLKGVDNDIVEEEVKKTLIDVRLTHKKDNFPTELSGGQKRSLSLGIAFIGGSKIVFLGQDPQTRRVTWDLISREKQHRQILLTTHFMDEADTLADRIAIMASGQIRCCGSPLFLKQTYGVGYTFTISLRIGVKAREAKPKIDDIIFSHVKNGSALSAAGAELVYRLPFEESTQFAAMFKQLDVVKDDIGISTYGISVTTLEEVFLKIGENADKPLKGQESEESIVSSEDFDATNTKQQKQQKQQPKLIPVSTDEIDTGDTLANDNAGNTGNTTEVKEEEIPLTARMTTNSAITTANDNDDDKHDEAQNNPTQSPAGDAKITTNGIAATATTSKQTQQAQQRDTALRMGADDYDNPFPMPTFKLDIDENATCWQKFSKEVSIFFVHTMAVLYRRFWSSLRDYRSICCQLLIPGILAAVGLGVIKLVITTGYPSMRLSVEKWHSAQDYVTIANDYDFNQTWNSSATIVNPILLDFDSWIDTFETQSMYDQFGSLDTYTLNSYENGTQFNNKLLNKASNDGKTYHYTAFYIPSNVENKIFLGFNVSAYHSWPTIYNIYHNWLLKTVINTNASITTTTHPLPQTTQENAFDDATVGLIGSFYLLIAFAFVPVGSIYQIVMDRSNLTKHQQFVSGMSLFAYWIGNFIADICNGIPAAILVDILVYIFDTKVYQGAAQGPFFVSIILFVFSITPFTYLLSYLFSDPSRAQRWTALLYIILGLVLLIVTFVLDIVGGSAEDTGDDLQYLFEFFPTFLLSMSVFNIALRDVAWPGESYWKWKICGNYVIFMIVEGFGYFCLVLLIEWISHQPNILGWYYGSLDVEDEIQKDQHEEEEDIDVENERTRIMNACATDELNDPKFKHLQLDNKKCDDAVVLAGLRKVYRTGTLLNPNSLVAVKKLWFGVHKSEVFGFLGVNGAGKTTALATLTGQRHPTSGSAFINGIPITNQSKIRRFVGYCPQFDALFDLLTAEEHLKFYGKLKGLEGDELDQQIDMLLNILNLNKYRSRQAKTYSGGNKRKLSVAMSMIGNPPILLLDEPSTGMDPVSRRHLWEFISKTMSGRCVILTTHSMEECEALAQRLVIMVDGELHCIGSPQHLKSRFGHGFQLDLTLKDGKIETRNTVEDALNVYFHVDEIEVNLSKVTYQLNAKASANPQNVNNNNDNNGEEKETEKLTLTELFTVLEKVKDETKKIVSYAVNQTSLEQIFLKMAHGSKAAMANQSSNVTMEGDESANNASVSGASNATSNGPASVPLTAINH